MTFYFVLLAIVIGVLALDFTTKYLSVACDFNVVIVPKILKFVQSYNKGAAFGFLNGTSWAKYLFIIFTILACLGIIAYFVYRIITKKPTSKWISVALALVFAGAIGNLYDRIFIGMVRDFILFFYDTQIFPYIFNVADSSLVIGVFMIIAYLLFIDKDAIFRKKPIKENKDES